MKTAETDAILEALNVALDGANAHIDRAYALRMQIVRAIRDYDSEPQESDYNKIVVSSNGVISYSGKCSNGTLGSFVYFGRYAIWFDVSGEVQAVLPGVHAAQAELEYRFRTKVEFA